MIQKFDHPWRFTIVFDEEKTAKNGYDIAELYDCIGRNVESLGNIRLGLNTWQAKSKEIEFKAQCSAMVALARMKWVMQNVKSWTVYEDEVPDGCDYLHVLRKIAPQHFI